MKITAVSLQRVSLLLLLNWCVHNGFCLCASKVITFFFPQFTLSQFSFTNHLHKDSCQEWPGSCKRRLRLPKCYQIEVISPTKAEIRRKKPCVCCSQRSPGPQSWPELHLSSQYLKSHLGLYSGGLALASAVSCPKWEMKMPSSLWTGSSLIALKSRCLSSISLLSVHLKDFYLSLAWLQGKGE